MSTKAMFALLLVFAATAMVACDADPLPYYIVPSLEQMNRIYGDKRSGGMLDFGLTRGMSGVDAAKARLGLRYAADPYGPGRR